MNTVSADYTDRKLTPGLQDALESAGSSARCLLLNLDIMDFQSVNHSYGFEAGNRLLDTLDAALAKARGVLWKERGYADVFFVLIRMEDSTTAEQVVESLEEQANSFCQQHKPSYPVCKLQLACGICPITAETVVQALDGASFARKESKRRGAPVVYSPMMQEMKTDQYQTEAILNLALHEERFCFYLQPKVDLTDGRIVGAEALARRLDDDGTVLDPSQFLPVMESTGSVVELDLLICRQVCDFLADRQSRGLPVVRTSVNLSRLHTHIPGTANRLHEIAQTRGVPPFLLEFELTETIFLEEFEGAKELIDQLRSYGYHVSIDDFGSGYAGINVWQELNFDVIKLDRCFLSEDPQIKSRNAVLVPNMINMGHRLHTDVVCEGVETAEQCAYLQRLGCTVVQGFYFSSPVSPEAFYNDYLRLSGRYPRTWPGDLPSPVPREGPAPPARRRSRMGVKHVLSAATIGVCLLCLLTGMHTVARYSDWAAGVLLWALATVAAILFLLLRRLSSQFTDDEQRYLLLEQFSDTVLFDYDTIRDCIRFTPNAFKLFRCHSLVQDAFLETLEHSYVFAGDVNVVQQGLRGNDGSEPCEFRIRLLHPETDDYFWCLVQCQYLRKKGAVVGVVGKLVNIDELERHVTNFSAG